MISHKYRCIYIHNPKTASSSIRDYFWHFLLGYESAYMIKPDKGRFPNNMRTLSNTVDMFPHYFTFTFVRNPFDRFVSSWLHRFDPNREIFQNYPMCNHSLREYAELAKDLLSYSLFASFQLDKEIEMGPHRMRFCDLRYERPHLVRQKDCLLDYNPEYYFGSKRYTSSPCSFIGKYETLEQDFNCLLDILGAPQNKLLEKNASLRRRKVGGDKRSYYSDYYDRRTRRLVEEIYADDLELLGYDFEEMGKVSIPKPLYDGNIARSRHAASMRFSVMGTFESYRRRIIFLAKFFKDRAIFIRLALLILFIYPVLTFFGLYGICRSIKRWLRGRANNK